MINLGLIGTGKQGERFMKTVLAMDGVDIVRTCNSKSDYKDLIDAKLDGVIIAADPAMNVEMIKYANMLGVPVLCEKPVGLYLSDVQKLEKCKIPILVNYVHLFSPVYQQLKAATKGKKINRIISIGYNQGPTRTFSSLYDYMPHDLSMALDLCPGDYEIVNQKANKANGGILYRAHFRCKGTEIQVLAGNGGSEKQRKLAVFCADGDQFIYDDNKSTDRTGPMTNLMNEFIEVIGGKKTSFDLSLQIHTILYRLGANYDKK